MSSTNKTSLGLNMWEASDKPVRQDFVNDNVIIDEKITKLNSDLASGIIQIGGIKYQAVLTFFLVPSQTTTTVFNVSDKIPDNATVAYCMQYNATTSPIIIGTFRSAGNKWTILTDVTNTGNFSVRAFYLIPL